jgi:hypothetical protein
VTQRGFAASFQRSALGEHPLYQPGEHPFDEKSSQAAKILGLAGRPAAPD